MTARVLRANQSALMTILEVFLHDPLYKWALTPDAARRVVIRTKKTIVIVIILLIVFTARTRRKRHRRHNYHQRSQSRRFSVSTARDD